MIDIGTAYIYPKYYNACTILDLQVFVVFEKSFFK